MILYVWSTGQPASPGAALHRRTALMPLDATPRVLEARDHWQAGRLSDTDLARAIEEDCPEGEPKSRVLAYLRATHDVSLPSVPGV